MARRSKKLTYDYAVKRLEEIVTQMEQADISIEESLKLYKEGIELSNFCEEELYNIQGEISELQKTSKGFLKKKFL